MKKIKEYVPVKFKRCVRNTPRPVTKKRIDSSKRAITRHLENYPLFAEQFATEMQVDTQEKLEIAALARIDEFQKSSFDYWRNIRDHRATSWRKARASLRLLSSDVRNQLVEQWNASKLPKEPWYFLDYLRDTMEQR